MADFYVQVGDQVNFSKTVGESDIYLFAGITGDFSASHVNEEYMKKSAYGRRIAQGGLMIGFMSTASSMMIDKSARSDMNHTPVSLGFDRIRFIGPVYINDTVNVNYRVKTIEQEGRRSRSEVTVTNQAGETVATGEHILQWIPNI